MTGSSRAARSAFLALCIAGTSRAVDAQDSAAVQPTAPLLGVDVFRLRPFVREYDVLAWVGDSVVAVGTRTVRLESATRAGNPAWLIVVTRTGAVPAVESLYVDAALRPMQWSGSIGNARLSLAFGRDSIFGGTTGPGGRQTIIQPGGRSLVVSTAMLEAVFPGMQWTPYRSDSVHVLVVDHVSSTVIPAELAVIGEDSIGTRPTWIVVLRATAHSVLFWVDQDTGALLRLQQPLPLNGASMLEYRPRAAAPGTPSP